MASTEGKKPLIRSNKAQIKYLVDYMNAHPHFAAGDYKTPQGSAQNQRQWEQLKAALDELGSCRSVDQWKVCWRDQKRKARVESGALNREQNKTGNVGDVPELSLNAQIVLNTIGEVMAVGCGPEESPIGFSNPTVVTSPSLPPPPLQATTAGTSSAESARPVPAIARPSSVVPRPLKKKRVRNQSHPPDRFLNAQLEMNSLLKELVKEVRRSNVLKEQNNLLIRRSHRR